MPIPCNDTYIQLSRQYATLNNSLRPYKKAACHQIFKNVLPFSSSFFCFLLNIDLL